MKIVIASTRIRLRSIVEDGFHHSFDFACDLYIDLAPEFDVLWSDDLPVAITLQLETCQKCRVPSVTASIALVGIDEDEVCLLSRSPTLSVSPEYIMSVDMQAFG